MSEFSAANGPPMLSKYFILMMGSPTSTRECPVPGTLKLNSFWKKNTVDCLPQTGTDSWQEQWGCTGFVHCKAKQFCNGDKEN